MLLIFKLSQNVQQRSYFSPKKTIEELSTNFTREEQVGRFAITLAREYFFGDEEMSTKTPGSLDKTLMDRLKAVVISKFGHKRSAADKEALWARARTALGHKCKTAFSQAIKRSSRIFSRLISSQEPRCTRTLYMYMYITSVLVFQLTSFCIAC